MHYSDSNLSRSTFTMQNPRAIRGPSTIVNRTVTLRRPRNADLREREYLTPKEVERLQDAARKHSRYGHRDATAILIAYRHGLRASELCGLTWNMIELDSGRIHVRRAKNGVDSTHPLTARKSGRCASCGGRTCKAELAFPIHPHACGFKLANDGVDTRALQHFLGHRNIIHTV